MTDIFICPNTFIISIIGSIEFQRTMYSSIIHKDEYSWKDFLKEQKIEVCGFHSLEQGMIRRRIK
jgi:hypothetical protein